MIEASASTFPIYCLYEFLIYHVLKEKLHLYVVVSSTFKHTEIIISCIQKIKKKNPKLSIDLTTPCNYHFISSIFFINKLLEQAVPILYVHVLNFYLLFNLSNLVLIHITPLKILSHRLPTASIILIFQECRYCFWPFFALPLGLNTVNHCFLLHYCSLHFLIFPPNFSSCATHILILLCSDLRYWSYHFCSYFTGESKMVSHITSKEVRKSKLTVCSGEESLKHYSANRVHWTLPMDYQV